MGTPKGKSAKAVALMRQGGMQSFRAADIPAIADMGGRIALLLLHESAANAEPTTENTLMIHLPAKAVDKMMADLVKLHAARLHDTKPAGNA